MGSSKKQFNGELFAMTQRWNQLIPYAQSLRSISENDKANQIMEKFDRLETIVEGNFCQNEIIWIKANSGRYNEEDESILYPIMELPFMQINSVCLSTRQLEAQKTYLDRSTFYKIVWQM
jgi:hypothetical protein